MRLSNACTVEYSHVLAMCMYILSQVHVMELCVYMYVCGYVYIMVVCVCGWMNTCVCVCVSVFLMTQVDSCCYQNSHYIALYLCVHSQRNTHASVMNPLPSWFFFLSALIDSVRNGPDKHEQTTHHAYSFLFMSLLGSNSCVYTVQHTLISHEFFSHYFDCVRSPSRWPPHA